MSRKMVIMVAMFGGIAAALLVWILLSGGEPSPAPVEKAVAAKRAAPELADRPRKQLRRGPFSNPRELLENPRLRIPPRVMEPRRRPLGVLSLDSSGIKRAVEGRQRDLDACYGTALFHTPGLPSQMVLTLQVEPEDGGEESAVTGVAVDSDLDTTILEGCIATVFEEVEFGFGDPAELTHAVQFSTGDK